MTQQFFTGTHAGAFGNGMMYPDYSKGKGVP